MSISSRTRFKLKQREESKSLLLNLPEGVHDEIFLKVPAKSILVSRCVCKFFYNLLSKPNFIKNHVNLSIQRKTSNPKLLFSRSSGGKPPMINSIPIDFPSISSSSLSSTTPLCECDVLTNYPSKSARIYFLDFLGTCNGLICSRIRSIESVDTDLGSILESKFCVLNPLTREFKEFKKTEKCYGKVAYGFGYDSSIDDYKLVVISIFGCLTINIYTLRSDSWTSIQGPVKFSFQDSKASRGVFFNGYLHWLGSIDTHGTSSEVIFSIDISNEIVVNMPLPENIMPPTDYPGEVYKNVGVWGDCVGIAFFLDPVRIDVWVMQEYGVKESWIKKYTTAQLPLPPLEILIWRPLWCFNNGEILIDTGGKQLLLYDPTTERFRSAVVSDITMGSSRESYVETIVSLGSGTYVEKRITDES